MIKELIKKYKPEFDHWMNGGTLLYRHFDHKKQEFGTQPGRETVAVNAALK